MVVTDRFVDLANAIAAGREFTSIPKVVISRLVEELPTEELKVIAGDIISEALDQISKEKVSE